MSAIEKPKCCAKVYSGGYWPHSCGRNAKVERDGRYYCGTHDPEAVKSRREKSHSQWLAKYAVINAIREKEKRKQEEQAFKAAMFDEMLDALKMVQEAAIEMRGDDFNLTEKQWAKFHAVIAKATNQQGNNHD